MNRHRERDQRWDDVRALRRGELDNNFPDLVSDAFPQPIVANVVDTTARDLAEMLAPLPSFSCTSVSMRSDAERKRADVRTKIVNNYTNSSRLDRQMLYGADQYFTYAMCIFSVEPDYDSKMPRVIIEDAVGAYPEWDRMDRLLTLTKRWWCEADILANLYPEHADAISTNARQVSGANETRVELIRFSDAKGTSLVLSGKYPRVLDYVPNRLSRLPFVIARRPWLDKHANKGQFDDVIWIQLARNILAQLQLEAVEKSVQAPLAVPADVQEVNYGPDAIMRSQTPEKIKRVGLEMTNMSFVEGNSLLDELRQGTRYPAARVGESDASVITGRGVQALLGGLESQIRAGQTVFREAFIDVLSMCLEMDETLWPNVEKRIKGDQDGMPYDIRYTPSKDIAGNNSVDAEYGFAAGMDPNRAVVMLLQLRAEGLFSRDYFQRQLPFPINISEENSKINVENTRDALLQSVYGYVQAIPALAQMGQDPAEAVSKVAAIVKGLMKGRPVEDVVAEAFAPPEAPEGPETIEGEVVGEGGPAGLPGGPGGAAGGGLGGGLGASGLMSGVPQGQAGQAPGGRPDLSVMLAGLTGAGKPSMSSFVMKRRRT